MTQSLLPPNASALDRAAEAIMVSHLNSIDQPHRDLWNPATCPIQWLPWMAWALSVDDWDPAWTEAQQRSMVAAAISLHRKKGTPWAIREALLRSGLESVRVVERPEGAHWAEFDVDVSVVDRPLTQEAIARAAILIAQNKPVRSVLRTLRTSLQTKGPATIAMALLGGDTTTVYPLEPEDILPEHTLLSISFGAHDALITTIYPQ